MDIWSDTVRLITLLFIALSLFAQERIVTLSPAIAEIVSSLGKTQEIVGVSDYTLYPPELTSRPKVGGYTALSIESVLAQKPTLVIGLEHQKPFLAQLGAFHVPTQVLRLESISDIKESIATLAARLGSAKEGRAVIARIDRQIAAAPKLPEERSVLIVFANASSLSRGVYIAGHDLFFEEILHLCGATNAYTQAYALQPVLTTEGIIATDPDHVLLLLGPLDRVDPKALKKRWQALPIKAAKNNRITVIQNDHILIPSQRISKTIPAICGALQ